MRQSIVPGAPGAPVTVGPTTQAQLSPPSAGGAAYTWAVVANVSPWLAVVIGAEILTLQPFEVTKLQVLPGQSISLQMTTTAGLPATSPGAAYIQTDWFYGEPDGVYPFSLTAQAVSAAVSGILGTITQMFGCTGNLTPTGLFVGILSFSPTITVGAGSATITQYPAGTGPANYNNLVAIVTGTTGDTITAQWTPALSQSKVVPASGFVTFVMPFLGTTQTLKITSVSATWSAVVLLGQEPSAPSVLLAGVTNDMPNVPVSVGNFPATQPVSGTVTSNQGGAPWSQLFAAISGLATAAADTTGLAAGSNLSVVAASAGKTITVYGIDITIVAGAVTAGLYVATLAGITSGTIVGATRGRALTAVGWGFSKMGALWIPGGFKLSLSEGLQLSAAAGNAGSLDTAGNVWYTQA